MATLHHTRIPRTKTSSRRSCRVTLYEDGCELAHLIPKVEAVQFARNRMMHYVNPGDAQAIHHPGNLIFLRADLHHLMDQREENRLVFCTMCKPPAQLLSPQFRLLYHNVALQELRGVSKECIFARIAWSVIPLIKPFLQLRWAQVLDRTLVLNGNCEVEELSGDRLEAMYNIISTQSPNRSRRETEPSIPNSDADAIECEYNYAHCSWDSFTAYSEQDDKCETWEDRPARGRKRRYSEMGNEHHLSCLNGTPDVEDRDTRRFILNLIWTLEPMMTR